MDAMTRYRVSFCDFSSDTHPAPDEYRMLDRDEILILMRKVLTSAGSFVSVMDEEGTMLQFMIDDDGSAMIDIPYPKRRGSYEKRGTLDDCVEAVRRLGDTVSIENIEGLEFARW